MNRKQREPIKTKKIFKILILIITTFILLSCKKEYVTDEDVKIALSNHLLTKYEEEFEVRNIRSEITGAGELYYRLDIFPKKYLGTGKEYDKYFWRLGNVHTKKTLFGEKIKYAADTYEIVMVNLSANEYFTPKLEELFGKQILPIFQIKSSKVSSNGDFIQTMNRNEHATIGGGVYIFGRVDNLEQKEEYRKKIFEFIKYLKEKGLFTRVDLAFYILDERCLTERFDTEIGINLLRARKNLLTADEFITYRKEQLDLLNEDYSKMTLSNKIDRIDKYNRISMLDIFGWNNKWNQKNNYSVIYHSIALSKKFLDSELRLQKFKKIDYNSLDEIKVYNTLKIEYGEYDDNKFYNHEWDGE